MVIAIKTLRPSLCVNVWMYGSHKMDKFERMAMVKYRIQRYEKRNNWS
jgi:hypothetical protein